MRQTPFDDARFEDEIDPIDTWSLEEVGFRSPGNSPLENEIEDVTQAIIRHHTH